MPATDHFRWNQKTLHAVFAASSVVLLISVIAMMKQDQTDEWREYQRTQFQLEAAVKERDLAALETEEYAEKISELELKVASANERVDESQAVLDELQTAADRQSREVERLEVALKFKNSIRDEARGQYDLAIRDAVPADELARLFEDFNKRQEECVEAQTVLDAAKSDLAETTSQLKQLTGERDSLLAELDKEKAESERIRASLEIIQPTSPDSKLKRALMELPIIDGFNGPLKVVQDWLPQLDQTLGMTKIARFDRCRTCHLNIDRTAAGNVAAYPPGHPSSDEVTAWVAENSFPQPFSTHPNHELFCTASSPHPVAKFGCTVCHDGQGSGTSFGNAEHTPNDPFLADQWHHQYGYHPNHFWEYPMQPERFQESTCVKCHHSMTELGVNPKYGASAPKVFRGYQLVQQYGCFGCHEIHGFDAGASIGPDLRLEPQTAAEAERIAADPSQVAGSMRKVGPSLRHIAAKTTSSWIEYWTEIPSRYRPSTRMPQFFNLTNQEDELAQKYESAELAGIARVLIGGSEPIDLLSPAADYVPSAERGKQAFSERGCLACHQHDAVPNTTAEFGPNISDIHLKTKRDSDNPNFSKWLYTWIREPERYHSRTKMPNLYLDTFPDADGAMIDPAADITAFLLSQGQPGEYQSAEVNDADLDELVTLYLNKARFSLDKAKSIVATGEFPQKLQDVTGDERALASEDGSVISDPAEWRNRKLEYVGRKTISKYGCYACHDMPGYELARPIGVALQDWGRKDTSKLGFEHIEEFLHHHGEPSNSAFSSTAERVETAYKNAVAGGFEKGAFSSQQEADQEMAAAYFYDSILHHGRAGFVWQKLRAPRSYDYMKTETKGYDERLRMPKFPFKEDEIEAIATFILGLVADPPGEDYLYTPDEKDRTRIQGEALLAKYNCTGCHMVDLPEVTFGANMDDLYATELGAGDYEEALNLLLHIRPPRMAFTGKSQDFALDEEQVTLPVATIRGLRASYPDPEEDLEFQEHGFDLWETAVFGEGEDSKRMLPGARVIIPQTLMMNYKDGRGGAFAEWLVEYLMESRTGGNRSLAWQASPPPLLQEGFKVQTNWLYQFLLEPSKIRYTTVLRMPRFNMSSEEARTLANYFAAVDGAKFPYDEVGPKDPDYLASRSIQIAHAGLLENADAYLLESWKTLNGPLCVKCHSVGGRQFKVSDPAKDIQGPNLNVVHQRLRADWLQLWLYNPKWVTPYTSMPVNFPKNNNTQFPDLFNGDPGSQTVGVRDALLNYNSLMESPGPIVYEPKVESSASPVVETGAE